MIDFVPVARTEVKWDALLSGAQKALGRSVSSSLDAKGLPIIGEAPFICAVSEFVSENSDALASLREAKLSWRHLSYTFLVALPSKHFLALASHNIDVSANDDFAIVTGRLVDWHNFVIVACLSSELKEFGCRLLAWFERQDLGEVWGLYEKIHTSDGLYFLVHK